VAVDVFRGLTADSARRLYEGWLGLTRRVEALPFPTVFAAHALCLTAAFELALACDLVVAAASARFGLVEVVIGATPSMGGTQRLAARAGSGRALELVMTGELFDAATLERWNVVNRVFPDAEFAAASLELARRLADGPTRAHAATKRVVRAFERGGVPGADDVLPEVSGALLETDDARRAIESFLTEGHGRARHRGC
jgi:enoyl-CoA hydratase/carnithine racemase